MIGRWSRERKQLQSLCAQSRTLCLTYDDGPGPSLTPELLRVLETHGAKATFFLLGRRAEAAPEVADAVRDAGHEIGCHSHEHLHAWKTPPWRSSADVARGYETLAPWLSSPCIFRPPYGKLTPFTRAIAARRGSAIGWWTIDSGDTYATLPDVESVLAQVEERKGGVVLMHDFDREPDRAKYVVELTDRLLTLAAGLDLSVRPLGAALLGSDEGAAA